MSKKPKHSRHRIPVLEMASDPITEDYQAEVDASITRLEARYLKAQKALEAAEAKAERKRVLAEQLAEKKADAERAAANRLAEEKHLTEYIERIKQAAKEARVGQARAELQRKHDDAVARRNAETFRRKAEAKERVAREQQIVAARAEFVSLERDVHERRRELREIQLLMMPGNYAGRDHRGRGVAHTAGGPR